MSEAPDMERVLWLAEHALVDSPRATSEDADLLVALVDPRIRVG